MYYSHVHLQSSIKYVLNYVWRQHLFCLLMSLDSDSQIGTAFSQPLIQHWPILNIEIRTRQDQTLQHLASMA